MFSKTFSRMTKMFSNMEKEMNEVFDAMDKEMNEAMKPASDLPEGTTEVVTEETETKPDGTIIHRKVTRRTTVK